MFVALEALMWTHTNRTIRLHPELTQNTAFTEGRARTQDVCTVYQRFQIAKLGIYPAGAARASTCPSHCKDRCIQGLDIRRQPYSKRRIEYEYRKSLRELAAANAESRCNEWLKTHCEDTIDQLAVFHQLMQSGRSQGRTLLNAITH